MKGLACAVALLAFLAAAVSAAAGPDTFTVTIDPAAPLAAAPLESVSRMPAAAIEGHPFDAAPPMRPSYGMPAVPAAHGPAPLPRSSPMRTFGCMISEGPGS